MNSAISAIPSRIWLALSRAGAFCWTLAPRYNICTSMSATSSKDANMTQRIHENLSAAEWGLVAIMGKTMPPRDPDDDDDEDEDNNTEPDDERQPPVVREPDEDE